MAGRERNRRQFLRLSVLGAGSVVVGVAALGLRHRVDDAASSRRPARPNGQQPTWRSRTAPATAAPKAAEPAKPTAAVHCSSEARADREASRTRRPAPRSPPSLTISAKSPSEGRTTTGPLGPGSRIPWLGQSWYLNGANVPWLNWSTRLRRRPERRRQPSGQPRRASARASVTPRRTASTSCAGGSSRATPGRSSATSPAPRPRSTRRSTPTSTSRWSLPSSTISTTCSSCSRPRTTSRPRGWKTPASAAASRAR